MVNDALTSENTVYVTYIASTPEKAWAALTTSACTTRYFFGRRVESDWRTDSPWLLRKPDGGVGRLTMTEAHPTPIPAPLLETGAPLAIAAPAPPKAWGRQSNRRIHAKP